VTKEKNSAIMKKLGRRNNLILAIIDSKASLLTGNVLCEWQDTLILPAHFSNSMGKELSCQGRRKILFTPS